MQHSDPQQLRRLIEERLKDTSASMDPALALPALSPEHTEKYRELMPPSPTPAAVLIPIVEHEEGLTLLFTERASHLKRHAGQIAFPGGKLESFDAGPMEAALRETEEEIGLSREFVTVAGYLPPQLILTGYCVTPVVGFVRSGFTLKLDSTEVAATFEVPLPHVLDSANHRLRERVAGGISFQVYDIPFGERNIWGATAGMLMALYRRLTEPA